MQVELLKASKQEENKQDIKSIDGIYPKETRTNKIKNEIHEIKKWEEIKKDLKCETNIYLYIYVYMYIYIYIYI